MKKRIKKKQKLHNIAMVVLLIAILLITVLLFCHVRRINIVGNKFVTDEEIADWIQSDRYADNSLYVWQKYKSGRFIMHPKLEAVEVSLKNPWTLKVRVYEKKMVGFVSYEDNFVYFGRDGFVLAIDREYRDGIPPIEGLPVSGAKLNEKLPVEDKEIFESLLKATQTMAKQNLTANRIVCQDGEIFLYFGRVCAQIGKSNLESRILQIPPILEKLGDKKGTIHLEHYQDNKDMISFSSDVWPEEQPAEPESNGSEDSVETSVEDVGQ